MLRRVYRNYIDNAKRREVKFDLSFSHFRKVMTGDCFYCGTPPLSLKKYHSSKVLLNGIDRINSEVGYTTVNCVTCCRLCNYMKSKLSVNDFLAQVNKIYGFMLGG